MAGKARTFKEAYLRRVKELREARGLTQEEAATALGVPLDRYKKYEVRTPLPPHLIEPFALLVGRDIAHVVTGKAQSARRGPRPPNTPAPTTEFRPRRAQGGQR